MADGRRGQRKLGRSGSAEDGGNADDEPWYGPAGGQWIDGMVINSHGHGPVIGVHNGPMDFRIDRRTLEDLARVLNCSPREAARELVGEPNEAVRGAVFVLLEPVHGGRILSALAPELAPPDDLGSICDMIRSDVLARIFATMSAQTVARALAGMSDEPARDALADVIAVNVNIAAAGCVLMGAGGSTNSERDEMGRTVALLRSLDTRRARQGEHGGAARGTVTDLLRALAPSPIVARMVNELSRAGAPAAPPVFGETDDDGSRVGAVCDLLESVAPEQAAAHLEHLARIDATVAGQYLARLGPVRAAALLTHLDESLAGAMLDAVGDRTAVSVLPHTGRTRRIAVLGRLQPARAARVIESLEPATALDTLVALCSDGWAGARLIRPLLAHHILSIAEAQQIDIIVRGWPGTAGAAIVHGERHRGGDYPLTGLAWMRASAAVISALPAIVARLRHDRREDSLTHAMRHAMRSLTWLRRAATASTAPADDSPSAARRYRRHRTLTSLALAAAVIALIIVIAVSGGGPDHASARAGRSTSSPGQHLSSSDSAPKANNASSPPVTSGAARPASSPALGVALPILAQQSVWATDCPSPTVLAPDDHTELRLSCDITSGSATINVVLVQYPQTRDPYARGRPTTALAYPRSRPWSSPTGAGTYLTYTNTDGRQSYWLENKKVPVAILVFGPSWRADRSLLLAHGYTLAS